MSEPGGRLPLLALDPDGHGRGRGSALRFVPTGGVWVLNRVKNDPDALQDWKEVTTDADPISLEGLFADVKNDPPLIVSPDGHLMRRSTYDRLHKLGPTLNPVSRQNDLFGIVGSDNEELKPQQIVFDNQGNAVFDETGRIKTEDYIVTEDYIPDGAGVGLEPVTVGPDPADDGEDREYVVRGQVWIWWGGDDEEEQQSPMDAAVSYRENIAFGIHRRIQHVSPQRVNKAVSVAIGQGRPGLRSQSAVVVGTPERLHYRRVSFEFFTGKDDAERLVKALNTEYDARSGWYLTAWACRWAELLTGFVSDHQMIVKSKRLMWDAPTPPPGRDPQRTDKWRFYRFYAIRENMRGTTPLLSTAELFEAGMAPAADALPGMETVPAPFDHYNYW